MEVNIYNNLKKKKKRAINYLLKLDNTEKNIIQGISNRVDNFIKNILKDTNKLNNSYNAMNKIPLTRLILFIIQHEYFQYLYYIITICLKNIKISNKIIYYHTIIDIINTLFLYECYNIIYYIKIYINTLKKDNIIEKINSTEICKYCVATAVATAESVNFISNAVIKAGNTGKINSDKVKNDVQNLVERDFNSFYKPLAYNIDYISSFIKNCIVQCVNFVNGKNGTNNIEYFFDYSIYYANYYYTHIYSINIYPYIYNPTSTATAAPTPAPSAATALATAPTAATTTATTVPAATGPVANAARVAANAAALSALASALATALATAPTAATTTATAAPIDAPTEFITPSQMVLAFVAKNMFEEAKNRASPKNPLILLETNDINSVINYIIYYISLSKKK